MSTPYLELRCAISAAVKDILLANGSGYLQYSSTGLPGRLIGCPFGRALITLGIGEFCDSSIFKRCEGVIRIELILLSEKNLVVCSTVLLDRLMNSCEDGAVKVAKTSFVVWAKLRF
jgi:hypothetical protein